MSITSPILSTVFFATNIASTSVPSITAHPRIAKPIPRPKKNPQNTDTSRVSSVITGKWANWTSKASKRIPKILRIPKDLFTVKNHRNINGALIIIRRTERGTVVKEFTINEIPVTPPSIKLFGSKNPSNQNEARNAPREISTSPLRDDHISMVIFRISLCSRLIDTRLTQALLRCFLASFCRTFCRRNLIYTELKNYITGVVYLKVMFHQKLWPTKHKYKIF